MKKSQKGIVIIEVLIAAVIFAFGILALVEFQTNLLRERSLLNQEDIALQLAQDKMQYFRSYTTLSTQNPTSASSTPIGYADIISVNTAPLNFPPTTTTNAGANYTITWTVTDSAAPTRKTVNITVTWTDATNTTRSVAIDSIIAQIDPKATGRVSENLP